MTLAWAEYVERGHGAEGEVFQGLSDAHSGVGQGEQTCSPIGLVRLLAKQAGQIFNTEGFGSNGMKRNGMAIYGATKQAIRYFTRSVIKEVAGGPIRVGTIIPGIVVSDMLAEQYRAASPRRRDLYSAFADLPETIAAELVPRLLTNQEHGAVISSLSPTDMVGRMLRPKCKKRGLLAAFDSPSDDRERVDSASGSAKP